MAGVVQGSRLRLIEPPSGGGRARGTAHFGEYKIPTVKDIPELKTVLVKGEDGVGLTEPRHRRRIPYRRVARR